MRLAGDILMALGQRLRQVFDDAQRAAPVPERIKQLVDDLRTAARTQADDDQMAASRARRGRPDPSQIDRGI
jgi:hypothetical protein